MADFADVGSPVWNNVDYNDISTQTEIMRKTHQEMVDAGKVVRVPESTINRVGEAYPDLHTMKKSERAPILRQKMRELKASLRQFLNGLRSGSYEFEVNGNILDARLYDVGVREVMDRVTQDKASMLFHSDQVFQNAQYLYSTPDYEGNPNIYRWNYFYTPVQIGDETVGVRIAIRDIAKGTDLKPESQIYNWGIKTDATLDGGSRGPKVASSGVSSVAPLDAALGTSASSAVSSDPTIPQPDSGVNPEYAQVVENDTTPVGAVLLPMVEQGQQKAAFTGKAGGCRSVNSKNMEMPAVPMINFSKWTTADINRGTVPKRENDRIKMVFKTAV